MKIIRILAIWLLLGSLPTTLEAEPLSRYENLPSCIIADSISNISTMEERGWTVTEATIISSPFGPALDFDGTNDIVTIGDISDVDTVKTVAFLVNSDTTSEQFLDLDGGSNYVHVSTGTVTAQGFTSPTVYVNGAAATTLTADTWNWVAVTTATAISPTNVRLATDNTNFGNCSIANLMLFNRVLTATEIADISTNTVFDYDRSLIAYYTMSNVNPLDASWQGSANNGTGTNTTLVDGYSGKALSFDGADSVVDTGSNFIGLNAVSITAWINPTGWGEGDLGRIADFNTALFYLQASGEKLRSAGSGTAASNSASLNEWQFVGITYSADLSESDTRTVNFYDDSVLSGTANQSVTIAAGAVNVLIGNDTTSARTFDGTIDEVRFYDTVLTNLQIEDIYARSR